MKSLTDSLTLFSAWGPGRPWHGATGSIGAKQSASAAIEALTARFEGRCCPRCGNSVRVNGIIHTCLRVGCGWQAVAPEPN